jgi:hypothetical protein
LGIAKLHFEIGAGETEFDWVEWILGGANVVQIMQNKNRKQLITSYLRLLKVIRLGLNIWFFVQFEYNIIDYISTVYET